jgi:elongation factor P
MLALRAPLDACAVKGALLRPAFRNRHRIVERGESRLFQTGARASMAKRDDQLDIAGILGTELCEHFLALVDLAVLEQVPPEHLTRETVVAAPGVEGLALEPHRGRELPVVRGRLCEVVVAVAEHVGRGLAAFAETVEHLLGLCQAPRLDIRLHEEINARHRGDRNLTCGRSSCRQLEIHTEIAHSKGLITTISTNQFKNGTHIEVDGKVFKIVEFQHVKPGKGGAFVRTKLKRVDDGAVLDKTFRAGEKFRPVRTETRKMQFLYSDGSDAHFMDTSSYEQIAIPEDAVKDPLRWVPPSKEVELLYVDEKPSDIQLPASVELAVTETEPGVRGDTASGGGDKPAKLETGVTVKVPLFVSEGDRIKVDTRSGSYMSRA